MKLSSFAFLADENIDREVVTWMLARGIDVVGVRESGLGGASDYLVLAHAAASNRVVLTHDSDFGGLSLSGSVVVVGIVFVRPGHIHARATIQTLEHTLEVCPEIEAPFIVVAQRANDQVSLRVRSLR